MSLYAIDSAILRGIVSALWLAVLLALVWRRAVWRCVPGAVRLVLAAVAVTGAGVLAQATFQALHEGVVTPGQLAGQAIAVIAGGIALAGVLRFPAQGLGSSAPSAPAQLTEELPDKPQPARGSDILYPAIEGAAFGLVLMELGHETAPTAAAGRLIYANRTARAWLGLEDVHGALPSLAALLTVKGQASHWPTMAERLVSGQTAAALLPLASGTQGPPVVRLVMAPGAGETGGEDIAVGILENVEAEIVPLEWAETEKLGSMTKLASGIAHDFSNVLTIILTACEILLLDEDLPPKIRQRVERMQRAAQRGGELSDQLRAFAGHQDLMEEEVDLNELLRSSIVQFKDTLGQEIDLHFDLVEERCPILVDPQQFRDAMLSIMKHCRSELPDGGKVELQTRLRGLTHAASEQRRDAVTLTVTNLGRGLSRDDALRLLEPYGLASPTGSGGGFGLSLVAGFVRQSRGRVRLTGGEAGQGTTLEIEFPLAGPDKGATDASGGPAPLAKPASHLLLVEDDEMVREAIAADLASLGCRTEAVASAAECLARLEANSDIDVVLADHSLTDGESGTWLARQVRERFPSIRIILMSGDLSRISREGLDGVEFLLKPFTRSQLSHFLGLGEP